MAWCWAISKSSCRGRLQDSLLWFGQRFRMVLSHLWIGPPFFLNSYRNAVRASYRFDTEANFAERSLWCCAVGARVPTLSPTQLEFVGRARQFLK